MEHSVTNSSGKELCTVFVTLQSGGRIVKNELILLAKDAEEISEKLELWRKCTRKGTHILSWEKRERKRGGFYGTHTDNGK